MHFPTIRERLHQLAVSNGAIDPSIVIEGCILACRSGRRTVEEVFHGFKRVRPDLFNKHHAARTAKKLAKREAKANR